VLYGHIMEHARAEIVAGDKAPLAWRLRAFFLREVIARPGRLRVLAELLRLYRASGVRAIAERVPGLRNRALFAPTISGRPFKDTGILARPEGRVKQRVAILTGCIMPLAFRRVHEATVRVLARNGCEVVAPPDQACCGALHSHNGDRKTAMALARRNVDAFLAADVDSIVVNSAGCGAAMKEYATLLAPDAGYSDKARQISSVTKDVHEFLVDLPFQPPNADLEIDVTYQDPCHLAHAQGISHAPRDVLSSIPGLRLIEMENSDRCCGSAGVYPFTQPEMSLRLLESKIADMARSGAAVIATANPGCLVQLEAGLRRHRLPGPARRQPRRPVHVIELLDEAYGQVDDSQGA
jgi:Fe-S oxidoreductase